MKIALVYFNLTVQAGGQRQFLSLVKAIQKYGHRVVAYAAAFNPEYFSDVWRGLDLRIVPPSQPLAESIDASSGIVARVRERLRRDRLYTEAAQRIVDAMDPDFEAVNCHEDFAYKVGFFYKKKNPSARIIWTMNNPPFMFLPSGNLVRNIASRAYNFYKNFPEKRFFRFVDMVTVLSKYEKAWAEKRGLPVQIVWSGLDFDDFYAPVKRIVPAESLRILGVGALNPYRRFEDIILAAKMLRGWGYAATVTLVCKDLWRESAYKAKLSEITKKSEMEPHVHFYFQGASEENLREIYRRSDIYVLSTYIPPPQGYGWGLSVFEAMASGLPVVLSRGGGAADILADGQNALFVNPRNPGEIARQIKSLADDPAFYKRIAESGQAFTKEHISWARYAEKMLRIFRGEA